MQPIPNLDGVILGIKLIRNMGFKHCCYLRYSF
jgi:hypothetical protein